MSPPLLPIDLDWLLGSTALVFFMQVGFCLIETGFVRAKNAVNVAAKNVIDFCVAAAIFWIVGFGVMFGPSWLGVAGTSGFLFSGASTGGAAGNAALVTFFLFQLVFCGTCATIISGAVAERMTYLGYICVTAIVTALIYPLFGHWAWAGNQDGVPAGWLGRIGFVDFAGSTVVHSVGGWLALACLIVIGPRLGRFDRGRIAFRSANLSLAALGALSLWFGWIGFNGGSTLALTPEVPGIIFNTMLGGAFGGLAAHLLSSLLTGQPRVDSLFNGVLAGLVAVTAGCHVLAPPTAAIVGAVGGIVAVYADRVLFTLRIDDSVGAVPVHLGAGIWGTLAVALLGDPARFGTGLGRWQQLGVQAIGVAVAAALAFGLGYVLMRLLDRAVRLRVPHDAEVIGLNVAEHGAGSDLHDLLTAMERHRKDGDFTHPVPVEPQSDMEPIAIQYKRVVTRVVEETRRRENALHELKDAQQQLVQTEKMAALGGLVAGMAHEINSPIGVATTAATHLQDEVGEVRRLYERQQLAAEDLEDFVKRAGEASQLVVANCRRAAELVQSFKRISVDQMAEERRTYQLAPYLREVLTSLQPLLRERGAAMEFDCPDGIEVEGPPGPLWQILTNLTQNALMHAFAGEQKGTIRISARLAGASVILRFQDDGQGIAPDMLPRIFDPFVTTARGRGGTGLGLHIVYNLVTAALGGWIDVESSLGKGTTFVVAFPKVAPLPGAAPAARPAE